MRVMTILGTRPEIIRLSRIIPKLDGLCDHTLVHTGQNYDGCLSKVFFDELGLRKWDYNLVAHGPGLVRQVAQIMELAGATLAKEKPDRVLILGDTNSGLSAIVAKRMGIPVYHLEAGNRCYDDRVPEEVNRRIIDHCSDVLMPYTERSRANLLREGIDGQRIFVVGNPMTEVMQHAEPKIEASDVLKRLGLRCGEYFLATVHRAETVDNSGRLREVMAALALLSRGSGLPVVFSIHPHTAQRLASPSVRDYPGVRFVDPPGFFDFAALEASAHCVVTDSGTVPEECCILRVPSVILRDVTERPEIIECGGSILAGIESESVQRAVATVTGDDCNWTPPPEYTRANVADIVVRILLGGAA